MTKFHNVPNIYPRDVVLKVVDLKRSLTFYQNIMGLKVREELMDGYVLSADGIIPLVTIISGPNLTPKLPSRTGLYHFAVLLPDRISLGLFLKNLMDENYPLTGGSHHGVSEAIYLQDPDDNGIEVYTDTPSESWDYTDTGLTMVTKPLDYNGLLALGNGKKWTGTPVNTILGHIHLHVGDLDKAYDFYHTLGFDITQKLRQQAYFVSTGDYHHHIGFNIWNGKEADPLPETSAGLKYLTLKFPTKTALRHSVERLTEAGYEVVEKKDMVWAQDPSGNRIRFVV